MLLAMLQQWSHAPLLSHEGEHFSNTKENGFREVYELNETKNEKNSPINNRTIHKFSTSIRSMDWINYSLTEIFFLKDLNARTKTIRNQIEKIIKEKN